MNATEALTLTRYVQACCPSQKIDAFTPDAWADLLADLPLDIAKVAAREVARTHTYVAPADIIAMAKRLRRLCHGDAERRVEEELGQPPADVTAYLEALRTRQALARRYADQAIVAHEYDPRLLAIESGDAA